MVAPPIPSIRGNLDDRIVAGYLPGVDNTGYLDSTLGLQRACLEVTPGQSVYLPIGLYRISAPLTLGNGAVLRGAISQFPNPSVAGLTGPVIQPTASFTGGKILYLPDTNAANTLGPSIRDITIDGSLLTTTADGIRAFGPVTGVSLENVLIYNVNGIGINCLQDSAASGNQYPYGWIAKNATVQAAGQQGIVIPNMTDATFDHVYALGCNADGWSIPSAPSNSRFIACRSEWSGSSGQGFNLSGAWSNGSGSGGATFIGCSTDRNDANGFLVTATGNAPLTLVGCTFRRDGRNGGAGGGTSAGLKVFGATIPIIATGITTYPGVDDTGAGANSPAYGIYSGSAPTYFNVTNALAHGATAGVFTDGTGVFIQNDVATRSGTTSAPSAITAGSPH